MYSYNLIDDTMSNIITRQWSYLKDF